jgi:dTDP-4-amino-4,6-dideoxygalactose transaminase
MIGEAEKRVALAVLDGSVLVHGPRIKAFEEAFAAFTGAPHAVAVSSCTAAMHLFYMSMGLGPGDEIIVSALTHTATAHAVELCGATPIFVDAEPETGNIDPDQIEARLTSNCRGIAVVHFLGMPADMAQIHALASNRGLVVLEDCALSVGTRLNGTHAGLLGDAGCFSFYPVKHITTAEGGMLITGSRHISAAVEKLRAFGVDRDVAQRTIPGIYDVPALGLNYRMNEIQAAIGTEQLKRLNTFLAQRKENYEHLYSLVAGIPEIRLFRREPPQVEHSYYCLSILLDAGLSGKRAQFIEALNRRGVGTSVYYPKPVPLLSYYRNKYGHRPDEFPVATQVSESSVALPVGPHLTGEDMAYIGQCIKSSIREIR